MRGVDGVGGSQYASGVPLVRLARPFQFPCVGAVRLSDEDRGPVIADVDGYPSHAAHLSAVSIRLSASVVLGPVISFRHVICEKAGRSGRTERPASPLVSDPLVVPVVAVVQLRLAVINGSVVALVPALTRSPARRAVVPALCLALTLSDATVSAQTLSCPLFSGK